MKQRKEPLRMCAACRASRPKKELVRVVRSPEGEASLDLTGKKSGRGAYVCRSAECINKAKKTRALQRALECDISEEVWRRLETELKEGGDE